MIIGSLRIRLFVRESLAPALRPGDVVVWDNLTPHHNAQVRQAVEGTGAAVEPLPPWSPDLTPIEAMFSKVKGFLRSVGARTTEAVSEALGQALRAVRLRVARRLASVAARGSPDHRCAGGERVTKS